MRYMTSSHVADSGRPCTSLMASDLTVLRFVVDAMMRACHGAWSWQATVRAGRVALRSCQSAKLGRPQAQTRLIFVGAISGFWAVLEGSSLGEMRKMEIHLGVVRS